MGLKFEPNKNAFSNRRLRIADTELLFTRGAFCRPGETFSDPPPSVHPDGAYRIRFPEYRNPPGCTRLDLKKKTS